MNIEHKTMYSYSYELYNYVQFTKNKNKKTILKQKHFRFKRTSFCEPTKNKNLERVIV